MNTIPIFFIDPDYEDFIYKVPINYNPNYKVPIKFGKRKLDGTVSK